MHAPSLLLEASAFAVLTSLFSALVGVWLICAAFAGYALRVLSTPMRLAFGFAGLLLFIPADAIRHGLWTDVAELALGAVLLTREIMAVRVLRQAT